MRDRAFLQIEHPGPQDLQLEQEEIHKKMEEMKLPDLKTPSHNSPVHNAHQFINQSYQNE